MERFLDSGLNTAYVTNGTGHVQPIVSQLLSKVLTDGLSRIGSDYGIISKFYWEEGRYTTAVGKGAICCKGWCSEGNITGHDFPTFINGTWEGLNNAEGTAPFGHNSSEQLMRSFPRLSNIDAIWTRVSFPIRRYGYSYSMSGVTVKVAAAILIFHALITVGHTLYVIVFDATTYNFSSSLGELIILAMGKAVPEGMSISGSRVAVRPASKKDGDHQWMLIARVHREETELDDWES